jgi:hypothetical protein
LIAFSKGAAAAIDSFQELRHLFDDSLLLVTDLVASLQTIVSKNPPPRFACNRLLGVMPVTSAR